MMNPQDPIDDLDLTMALRELSNHAPERPDSAGVHHALRRRTQRRKATLIGAFAIAGAITTAWVVFPRRAEVPPTAPSADIVQVSSPRPNDRTFSLVSVGEFSPRAESTMRMPQPGYFPSMTSIGMGMPRVSISMQGLQP
jgi:hypothetical protein